MRRRCCALFAAVAMVFAGPAPAAQPPIRTEEWALYKSRFLDVSGRIVDNANGDISHSEGQGYGLLLAYLANSPADFEQIWYFTQTELLLRDDGLAVWKWNPQEEPRVTDTNNATDGDILIAYALALAGAAWRQPEYIKAASVIARGILNKTVVVSGGRTILLPGASGFSAKDRDDGPVVNPSYWIFEAFPVLELLAPSDAWRKVSQGGLDIVRSLQFGPALLPAEWVSLKRRPEPASGFDREFSYNSIRIPLYLARAGVDDVQLLKRLQKGMTTDQDLPAIVDLDSGQPKEVLADAGYQIVNHIVACVVDGTKLPSSAFRFEPEFYYPSTLQLLGLAFVREKHPECL